ncbi:Kinase-related protein of unknown function [Forsythia ovata]|uniref:GBF-interacting protein 1 N-terminal domain-containing protein n=1 Tax=Forsythia ovata TaxID=205694 RepID=A0ABD1R835_9LAMI
MSTGRGSSGGAQAIPAASRKMVQSLKEIVNWPEAEIYSTLKDCNMDPNEAVNRLLSQDPFHEVKSKRGKKKENAVESRTGDANKTSTRGGKSGANRYLGHGGSSLYNPSEPGILHGKPAYKKENGPTPYISSSSSTTGMAGNNINRRHAPSDGTVTENKVLLVGGADDVSSGTQPSSGYQHTWVGVPGQVSMADIVKMGRQRPPSTTSHQNLYSHEHHVSNVIEPEASLVQNLPTNDEWPSMKTPTDAEVLSVSESPADFELHPVTSNLPIDRINQHSQIEEVSETEDDDIENLEEDDSVGASPFENDLYKNMGSHEPPGHDLEHHEGEEVVELVSSITGNLQKLSIETDDRELTPEEDGPFVVIPDHLRVQTADCSHLNFGSFRSVVTDSSGRGTPIPAKTNLEGANTEANILSVGHSDTRTSEYFGDESLRNATGDSLFHRTAATAGNYDTSSASQPDDLKPENAEVAHGDQYAFTASNPGYAYQDAHHLNAAFSQSQTSSHMQNLAPFSSVTAYTDSLPSTLLASNVNSGRESDFQHPAFPVTQLMPTEYGNSASSVGGSAISMAEINQALKTVDFSSTQPAHPALSGTSVPTGSPLPQHLPVHPYSQPTLPLGPFANMIGYPFLPQSYAYMPSAFQQAFAGNNAYHQSLAAMLPQYKNSVSVNNAPQSAAIASGYGALGNTLTIPGNFSMSPPAASSGTTLSYEDLLSSQYKDSSHLISLQQNENSATWLHGPNSRTSAVPASTYYNYEGQNPPSGGFRQVQQPSQNYGAPGYPNFYHSPTGISLDQQQIQRDGSLAGSQGQPKQSQVWQNNY